MIKKAFLFIFFISSASLWCENIFVYIEKGIIDIDEENNKFSPELLNMIEDGIMDSFFDQGHIVFAANSAKTSFATNEALSQTAKKGGADLLFKAVINYSENDNIAKVSGSYMFYNLLKENVISEGEYILPDDFNMSGLKVEDLFFDIGKGFAGKVSGTISIN